MAWHTSDRRERLPANWAHLRALVRARAGGRCEAEVHVVGCDLVGTDCDHRIPGDDHSPSNLLWLSAACHKAKTAKESAERNRLRAKMRKRKDAHPFFDPGG